MTLDLMAQDTPDQELLDTPVLPATNSSSNSHLTLPPVVEAMAATSNPLLSLLNRTLDMETPTTSLLQVDSPRITSPLLSTPEHTWDLVVVSQMTRTATGCPPLLLLSSPSTLPLLHLNLRILLLLLLTNTQVKHPLQLVHRPTSRCTPRIPPTVEVSLQELPFPLLPAPRSDSNPSASPAGSGQQPSGFAPQVQQYGDAPNPRASVPPQSAPAPSSGANKRRSDRDDDRHTPTDRHSRQPRR